MRKLLPRFDQDIAGVHRMAKARLQSARRSGMLDFEPFAQIGQRIGCGVYSIEARTVGALEDVTGVVLPIVNRRDGPRRSRLRSISFLF